MNAFFYNESFLTPSEKDSLEEDFLNPNSLKDEKEYRQEESKSKCLSPLNNTKSESSNIINMNNEKPTNFMKHNNILKNIMEKEEKEEEEEENNEKIKSNNNSFVIAKTDYSNPIYREDENNNKNSISLVQNKLDSNIYIKEFDIDLSKENIILKNREIKENKISSSPLFLSKDMPKSKLIFSVKSDKLNNNYGKKKKDELAKKESNNNIIKNNELQKRDLLGKKIKRNKIMTSNIKVSIKRGPYKRKNLGNIELNLDDKCFPFKKGKGIINLTSKFNYEMLQENKDNNNYDNNISSLTTPNDNFDRYKEESENVSNLNLNLNEKNLQNCVNELYLMKFVTKKFFISENGRKKTVKNKRKYKGDIIRKKIKSRFHKSIKNIINDNLKKAGSEFFFDFLPQCFIGNTSKKLNKTCLEMTYKELLSTDFYSDLCKTMLNYKNELIDKNKFNKNKCTLEYLKNNPEISKKSGFDYIKDMKYKTLLNNYFISKEFEDSLHQVKEENEAPEYIQFYIYRAKNYVNFYNNYKFEEKNCELNENEDEDDDDDNDDYDEEDD